MWPDQKQTQAEATCAMCPGNGLCQHQPLYHRQTVCTEKCRKHPSFAAVILFTPCPASRPPMPYTCIQQEQIPNLEISAWQDTNGLEWALKTNHPAFRQSSPMPACTSTLGLNFPALTAKMPLPVWAAIQSKATLSDHNLQLFRSTNFLHGTCFLYPM